MPPTPNTVDHLMLSLYLCSEIARWGEVKYDNYVILTANKWKLTIEYLPFLETLIQ